MLFYTLGVLLDTYCVLGLHPFVFLMNLNTYIKKSNYMLYFMPHLRCLDILVLKCCYFSINCWLPVPLNVEKPFGVPVIYFLGIVYIFT